MTNPDPEFQDQGALDQPEQSTDGPVDPTLDEHLADPAAMQESLDALSNQDPAPVDDNSGSTIERVNEAREAGEPLTGATEGGTGQPAADPAGTGVADAPAAGSADTST